MKVYFAHSFDDKESHAKDRPTTTTHEEYLQKMKVRGVTVLDPAKTAIPWPDYQSRFRYCLDEIQESDVLIVDATKKLGMGVGAEMMHANKLNITVFAVCPDSSHYRKPLDGQEQEAEWIHPFIYGLSTKIFRSMNECVDEVFSMSRPSGSNGD